MSAGGPFESGRGCVSNIHIGQMVSYTLTAHDAEMINKRRADYRSHRSGVDTGHICHVGNEVREGGIYPAMVVRMFTPPTVNLQVFLDGNDVYWATSRHPGEGLGCWS